MKINRLFLEGKKTKEDCIQKSETIKEGKKEKNSVKVKRKKSSLLDINN